MPILQKAEDINWKLLLKIEAPSASANPVVKLIFNDGDIFWLKAAQGGERVIFADQMMNRVGFNSVESGIISKNKFEDLQAMLMLRRSILENSAKNSFQSMVKIKSEHGISFILSRDVGGSKVYTDVLDFTKRDAASTLAVENVGKIREHYRKLENSENVVAIKRHLAALKVDKAQRDMARMMAVDILLGNFDRISIREEYGNSKTQLNCGNFIYDAASQGLLPIDNDMLSPSLKHLGAENSNGKKPTREDLYRVAIFGGALFIETDDEGKGVFAMPEQADSYSLLGVDAAKNIYKILVNPIHQKYDVENNISKSDLDDFEEVSENIALFIREEMRSLLMEMKTETSKPGSEGFFKTLKAFENLEGMDYDVFKVRARFSELMTLADIPPSKAESEKYAISYGMYRDWKDGLLEILNFPGAIYNIPDPHLLEVEQKLVEKFRQILVKAPDKNTYINNEMAKTVESAKNLAKFFSAPLPVADLKEKYTKLMASYVANFSSGNFRNRDLAKNKVIVIAVLVRCELLQMRDCFKQLHQESIVVHSKGLNSIDNMVARVYARAFYKREATMQKILNFYRQLIEQIKQTIQAVRSTDKKDMELIGIGGQQEDLLNLCRDCNRLFNAMKVATAI